jgi:adenine deaminase
MNNFEISGNIVDIINRRIFPGVVTVNNGIISSVTELCDDSFGHYILPGFVDAHIHIESSMLIPSEFARLAVIHGTVATVSDPHEIANVLGIKGVRYMINNGKQVPFRFYFGAPSCVPATLFETAGAEINANDIRELFEKDGLRYMSEMMNYPGVLYNDKDVMEKLSIAKKFSRPVDGHAPGLRGEEAKKYISAGISTDHECFTYEEAAEKIKYGMKILIREGSAAKNFEVLHPLINEYPESVMFCSDDKHPNDLLDGHINEIVKRAIEKGHDLFNVLKAASYNAVQHYGLDTGLLREGDPADFIISDDLKEFRIKKTYINGILTSKNGETLIERVNSDIVNKFSAQRKKAEDFKVLVREGRANDGVPVIPRVKVIEALEGQLVTEQLLVHPFNRNNVIEADPDRDILKIAVVNRYNDAKPALAFIKNFGLNKGAIASCVAHDSHNIIAVGVSDEDICNAVNAVIDNKGGVSVYYDGKTEVLPLPVAGIMSNENGFSVAEKYTKIDKLTKELGTELHAPFMTLSFMALLVIPKLKLSDKGLFDGGKFEFTDMFVE